MESGTNPEAQQYALKIMGAGRARDTFNRTDISMNGIIVEEGALPDHVKNMPDLKQKSTLQISEATGREKRFAGGGGDVIFAAGVDDDHNYQDSQEMIPAGQMSLVESLMRQKSHGEERTFMEARKMHRGP